MWQTLRYQAEAIPRSKGASPAQVDKEAAFVDFWLDVARTGKHWEDFRKAQQQFTDVGEMLDFPIQWPVHIAGAAALGLGSNPTNVFQRIFNFILWTVTT